MLRKNKNYIILILGFGLGIIFIVFFKKISSFEINNQISININPFDIIIILINVFLALFITNSLGKKIDNEKNKKQLVTNFLDEFRKNFINTIREFIDKEEFENDKVRFEFKNFRQRNFHNIRLMKELNLIDENNEESEILRVKINNLWEEFTDVPLNENNVNKMIRLQNIYNLINDFEIAIIQLIFKINS